MTVGSGGGKAVSTGRALLSETFFFWFWYSLLLEASEPHGRVQANLKMHFIESQDCDLAAYSTEP